MVIFWFRRDLRLEDNTGLIAALNDSDQVLPIFIFDTHILGELPPTDSRISFIARLLAKINASLATAGKSLAVFHGEPTTVIEELISENSISAVYTNSDYEPYGVRRDEEIHQLLSARNIEFREFKDHVIFEKDEITKDDGSPYVVFTPYSKRWKEKFASLQPTPLLKALSFSRFAAHNYPFIGLPEIGFTESSITVPEYDVSHPLIQNYGQTRNFPGSAASTSRLSPHLRFGSVSIRMAASIAANHNNEIFLNELIWREFFIQILWHFPHTVGNCFRPKYEAIRWSRDEEAFRRWCEGKTGYPLVDAGMRELNATGLMHNRVRMVVASFLCKHLLIDWRWGEAYFAMKLLDYEQASNVGNWQWAAGCGVDAAPYFRIFNPQEQARKFDKDLRYISKWVPEFGELTYPQPVIDHAEARERCLWTYKSALN